jgi:DNA-binding GntR family transcriptional regulator
VTESFVALTKARGAAEQHDRHRAFHLVLMSRCTNRTLLAEIGSLMDRSRLYQFVAKPIAPGTAHADDHRLLMEFAVSGRVDDTIRVHTAHLTNTLRAVEALRLANQSAE